MLNSKLTTIIAGTAAAGLSGAAIAAAATSGSPSTSTAATTQQAPSKGHGAGETPLTGTTKEKVEAAALAKVPGTVIRTETDNGGVYESHIRKSDGTEVEVKVDKDFKVTAVEEHGAGGHDGRGGHGGHHADLAAVAKDLGVSEAKLKSAVDAARAAETPDGKGQESAAEHAKEEAARYAAIAKSLGKDADAVKKAFEANRPAKPATP